MAGTSRDNLVGTSGALGHDAQYLGADWIARSGDRLAFRHAWHKDRCRHLYAALSAYLLAGIYFGLLYWLFEQVRPGTFVTATKLSRPDAIYFSFVTLATLGYGDIVPRTDVARGLAVIEGVGGQLFLAVLVARLLSLYSRPAGD
jgi:hypothetical protein